MVIEETSLTIGQSVYWVIFSHIMAAILSVILNGRNLLHFEPTAHRIQTKFLLNC